ncbi:MAG: hypothetical protein KatS3mg076_0954 [Candidatus Binatia bacterium]|nr:MAG: hypothetical protein KatS3mg076_0954 [Candidatus Binatia bacterium]
MRGAKLASWFGALFLGLVSAAAGAEKGAPVTNQDRMFDQFTYIREAAIVDRGQLRLEVHGLIGRDDKEKDGLQVIQRRFPAGDHDRGERRDDLREVSGGIVGLRGSYGLFQNLEVGFDVLGVIQGLDFADAPSENEADMGDLYLYGKYLRQVTDELAVGAGADVRVPTGSERKRLGTGEVGATPFVNARYTSGRWAVGAHAGFEFNDDELDDVFNWSSFGIFRATDSYALRAEIVGRHFEYGGVKVDEVVVVPGIDYNFSDLLTLRPVGLAGVTDEALDYGLGLGIVLSF